MRVIKIPALGSEPMIELDLPAGYPALNNATFGEGRNLEQVYPQGLEPLARKYQPLQMILLVDEEGLYVPDVELNMRASILYGMHVHRQPIVGDAYFVAGDSENWVSLPAEITIEELLDTMQYALDNPENFR